MRLVRVLLVASVFLAGPALAACAPAPPPAACESTPAAPFIAQAFTDVGIPDQIGKAYRIAWRESHCDPNARNRSGASGLFQIMLPLHADLFSQWYGGAALWSDPYINAVVAAQMVRTGGWGPWGG